MKGTKSFQNVLQLLCTYWVLATTLVSASLFAQTLSSRDAYLDPHLPVEKRVNDLVSRMTLEEKVSQMQSDAPGIPRLHILPYNWWNEGLHGIARSGYATVFPQAIGLAATWDTVLIHQVADTISTEARAKYNQAQREKNYSIYYGLTIWSPNINIVRDPRWGRGQETYGEDPFLTGQIGSAFVRGLQGDDPTYFKTIATAKHFAVHSGPESDRHTFDAVVSPHDLEDTYLPAFRELVVAAHAHSVMCAYNAVDGAPACASDFLLQQKLKREWHFHGFVVSDCAAITDVAVGHKFAPDLEHASAASVKAGTDLSCGKEYAALTAAVGHGLISEPEIDAAVKRLFTARFRLGMFDPEAAVPYNTIPCAENDSPAHAALALQTARASMVLLKNDRDTLPLAPAIKTIAVVGPTAAALPDLEGNYNAIASHPVSPLAALQRRLPGHVLYAQGSPYVEGLPVPVPETAFEPRGIQGKHGLLAEYYADSNFSRPPVLKRVDSHIDFDWNGASPAQQVPAGNFGVRWYGTVSVPAPGTYGFGFSMAHCSSCEDEETVKVWLDTKLAYEFKHARTPGRRAPTTPFELRFEDTRPHSIRVEYTHDAPHFGAGLTFNWKPPVGPLREAAVSAAKEADAIVAFLGLSPEIEGEEMPIHVPGFEGGDRSTIELPAVQQQLIESLAKTGKPLILVLMNGSAIALKDAEQKAAAILEAWYPGQAGGTAIAETLYGENNPAGRLPVTFYKGTEQLPAFSDYSMQNRTYRYFTGEPLYLFGYGMSYSRFHYSGLKLSDSALHAGQALTVRATVQNVSDCDGEEVVEVYLMPKGISSAPLRQLVGFERIPLKKAESKVVSFVLDPRRLSVVSPEGIRSVVPGEYELSLGGGQSSTPGVLTVGFRIEGTAVPLE